MNRRYFHIVLGLTIFCLGLIFIFFLQKPVKEPPENVQAIRSPFVTHITGVGVVEPKYGNINIGIPFNRIVKRVNVSVNDRVKKGDVLVQLDHEDLIANLQVKQKEFEKAAANLQKLKALPRKEDLLIAEESLKKAEVALNESKIQYEMTVDLPNPNAISKEETERRYFRYKQAEAQLREIQARYDKIKAGTWQPDLQIALYQVEQARADVDALKAEIDRTYIKSPIDGRVLQIKIREGETPGSDLSPTTLIVGNTDELFLRVSIDQFNVSKFTPDSSAIAFRQGDHSKEFPLEFVHIEPYMIPKKYLTNAVDEQIDTQVLEILYRISLKDSGLFIGEQMDVFIDKKK